MKFNLLNYFNLSNMYENEHYFKKKKDISLRGLNKKRKRKEHYQKVRFFFIVENDNYFCFKIKSKHLFEITFYSNIANII